MFVCFFVMSNQTVCRGFCVFLLFPHIVYSCVLINFSFLLILPLCQRAIFRVLMLDWCNIRRAVLFSLNMSEHSQIMGTIRAVVKMFCWKHHHRKKQSLKCIYFKVALKIISPSVESVLNCWHPFALSTTCSLEVNPDSNVLHEAAVTAHFSQALWSHSDWSCVEWAACGQQAFYWVVVPELARRPTVPPRCSSLSIIKVGSARASGPGSFINWITCKINVHLLQRSNGLLPLAEIISVGLRMTAEGSAQWMGRFAALHTKWIVHHCLIKGLLETLVSSPPDSKP